MSMMATSHPLDDEASITEDLDSGDGLLKGEDIWMFCSPNWSMLDVTNCFKLCEIYM
jgi:hypothetical protein